MEKSNCLCPSRQTDRETDIGENVLSSVMEKSAYFLLVEAP